MTVSMTVSMDPLLALLTFLPNANSECCSPQSSNLLTFKGSSFAPELFAPELLQGPFTPDNRAF